MHDEDSVNTLSRKHQRFETSNLSTDTVSSRVNDLAAGKLSAEEEHGLG
jgi:hypothetical protein